jgi:dienelactone hydrolase
MSRVSLCRSIVSLVLWVAAVHAVAAAMDPRQAESLTKGAKALADLEFPSEAKELGFFSDLRNGLFKPEGSVAAKSPALVIAHTCGGVRPAEAKYWLRAALDEGYVVLVLDSLRGNKTNCIPPVPVPYGRLLKDLYDAAQHLSTLPFVDPQRIAAVGFSQGAFSAGLLASPSAHDAVAPGAPRFAATAGLYGTCQWPVGTFRQVDYPIRFVLADTDRPLLYLMAQEDAEAPSRFCDDVLPALAEQHAPVEWYRYPAVTHCWDCSTLNGFSKVDFQGHQIVYRYDKDATEDSRRRVFDFLRRRLGAADAAGERGRK